jgi:peroxiredoxin
MKRILFALVAFVCGSIAVPSFAADDDASTSKKDVSELIRKVNSKLQQGKDTEADLQAELKEFDALVARLKTTAPAAAAEAAFMKALLYVQVWNDGKKGAELMRVVSTEFPKTPHGTNAGEFVASLERQTAAEAAARAASEKAQEQLKVGKKFPDFDEKDLKGKPFSLAAYKGNVVLIDFWATWCGPCRAELPNVLSTYAKYHSKGFEVLGISLDDDKEVLENFIKTQKMTWPQYFDGKAWENKLSQKYGITGIPATFLIDGEGTIIARDLRGPELAKAVGDAVGKK